MGAVQSIVENYREKCYYHEDEDDGKPIKHIGKTAKFVAEEAAPMVQVDTTMRDHATNYHIHNVKYNLSSFEFYI